MKVQRTHDQTYLQELYFTISKKSIMYYIDEQVGFKITPADIEQSKQEYQREMEELKQGPTPE